jgi:predicted flap endonuclease-1-like 5' DNA nuclease
MVRVGERTASGSRPLLMHGWRLATVKDDATHPNAARMPHGLSGPALRALARAGIRSTATLARWTEADLAALHGIGPKAIRTIKDALARHAQHLRRT